MPKQTKQEVEEAREALAWYIDSAVKNTRGQPVIYIDVVSVAKSGMSRNMRVFYIHESDGGYPPMICRLPSKAIAYACGLRYNESSDTVRVEGAGMDMLFVLARKIATRIGREVAHTSL